MTLISKFKLDYDINTFNQHLKYYGNNIDYKISLIEYDLYSEITIILESFNLPNIEFTRTLVSYFYVANINNYFMLAEDNNEYVNILETMFKEDLNNEVNINIFNTIKKEFNTLLELVEYQLVKKLNDSISKLDIDHDTKIVNTLCNNLEYFYFIVDEFINTNDVNKLKFITPSKLLFNKDFTNITLLMSCTDIYKNY